ncbi:NAD-dependent epimerase/dehydratase family protein [Rhodobacteraceae bacterium R_SAG7]|nr:NAD-dependent epimerase/dehydratase family protein [Rhodobacteraceae bacterium R_SAG7]
MTSASPPLVLGASGRIGRALRYRWGAEAARWQARRAGAGAGWHLFDPLDQPDTLVTAAAQAGQILCLAGPVPAQGVDLEDHIRLAEASVRAAAPHGLRVVLASSAAVYGAQEGLLHEDLPLCPTNPYGEAKTRMEARARALGQELGVSVSCLRIGNIAGFDAILGGWRPGFRLDQFADGRTPRRSYIGPLTLADVLAVVLAAPELPEVLNIAQPEPVEMGALLTAAGRAYATAPAPQSAIAEVALDLSRLVAFLAGTLDLPPADPAAMIAEMALLEPHMKD